MDAAKPVRRGCLILACAVLLVAAALMAAVLALPRWVENEIARRLRVEAKEHGASLDFASIHFSWFEPLRFEGLKVNRGTARFFVSSVGIHWSFVGPGISGRIRRVDLGEVHAEVARGFEVHAANSSWEVLDVSRRHLRLRRTKTEQYLEITSDQDAPGSFQVSALDLDFTGLLTIALRGQDEALSGRVSGTLRVLKDADVTRFSVLGSAEQLLPPRSVRIRGLETSSPVDLELAAEGRVNLELGTLELSCVESSIPGFQGKARIQVHWFENDFWVAAEVPRVEVDLAQALSFAGVVLPEGVRVPASGLGTARLSGEIEGYPYRPASWKVKQTLEFDPPPEAAALLSRFRSPFLQTVEWPKGKELHFPVGPMNPDFVAFESVPPLLLRALLIAEDSSFFSHRGIDLEAIPVAFSLNLSRGGPLRGASTITQQTVKNLLLKKERTFRRKLQEVCLALLLESALPKRRILEIYLNIIEWGPGIYGLGRASCYYFNKAPSELTPREIAFLVTLIPGPVKYQGSLRNGTPTGSFNGMINRLLAKLASVQALSEDEYQRALLEELRAGPIVGPVETIGPLEAPGDDSLTPPLL